MNILSWLIVGAFIGWLATKVMRPDAQQGLALNIVTGIVGALVGGWFLSPLLDTIATLNRSAFSAPSVFVSVLAAILLLAAATLVPRRTVR